MRLSHNVFSSNWNAGMMCLRSINRRVRCEPRLSVSKCSRTSTSLQKSLAFVSSLRMAALLSEASCNTMLIE